MLTPGQLAQCRQTHESIFLDRVEIRHPGFQTSGPIDPETGVEPTTPLAPIYTGPARVQAVPIQSRSGTSAEQGITVLGYAVAVPVTVVAVEPEDIVTVTESLDPGNVGKTLRVVDVQSGTFATARRLTCTDYQEG